VPGLAEDVWGSLESPDAIDALPRDSPAWWVAGWLAVVAHGDAETVWALSAPELRRPLVAEFTAARLADEYDVGELCEALEEGAPPTGHDLWPAFAAFLLTSLQPYTGAASEHGEHRCIIWTVCGDIGRVQVLDPGSRTDGLAVDQPGLTIEAKRAGVEWRIAYVAHGRIPVALCPSQN
jgi:hypothetical protein